MRPFNNLKKYVFFLFLLLSAASLLLTGCGSDEVTDSVPQADSNDEEPVSDAAAPMLSNNAATNIGINSATISGNLDSLGDSTSADVVFEISTQPGNYMTHTPIQTMSETGDVSVDLNGLYAYMTYYYRLKATGESTGYSEEMSFRTGPDWVIDETKTYTATMSTNYGDIVIDLFPQDAPITVNNFVRLAQIGYYDNLIFHRVVKDFMIQSGDPNGNGTGDPGYTFIDEPISREYEPGTLAMANRGANTNGSQFFICLTDLSARLPKDYTIFGMVTQGFDVVQAIGSVPVTANIGGEMSKPVDTVSLISITIVEK